MKLKIVVVILLFIFITLICYYYLLLAPNNIRKRTINLLEERLEFCVIVKEKINSFFDIAEFWLVCNKRPFYVQYTQGDLHYEFNGWDFLKHNYELWNELVNCEFYDSKKVDKRYYNLIFYCPRHFNSTSLVSKTFLFDSVTFVMDKINESNFVDILTEDIKEIYPYLFSCRVENFTSFDSSSLWLVFNCNNQKYIVGSNLLSVPIQVPIILNDLPYEERANISFRNTFNLPIINISTTGSSVSVFSSFVNNKFIVNYKFEEIPRATYKIYCVEDEKECISKILRYFVLPPINREVHGHDLKLIKEFNSSAVYKVGDDVISVRRSNGIISHIFRNRELIRGVKYEV